MPSRILFFISDLGSGGSQKSLFHLSNYLISKNYQIKFIVLNKDVNCFYKYSNKIEIIYLRKIKLNIYILSKLYHNLFKIYSIAKIMKRYKSDYHISMLSQTNVLVAIANKFSNKTKLILCERNDPFKQQFNIFWKILIRFSYSFANILTVNSPNAYNYFKSFIKKEKIKYVINYVKIKHDIKFDINKKNLVAVGRLNHQKGYDILIRAFKNSQAHTYGWKLKIIGNTSNRMYYKKLINLSGDYLNSSIFFLDEIKSIEDIYKSASFFIISSRYEGTPNSLLEASSFGVPSIISDSIKLKDNILVDKKNCIIFKNEDVVSCTQSIDFAINNYKSCLIYGNNLKKLILSNYSLKNANKSWDQVIGAF